MKVFKIFFIFLVVLLLADTAFSLEILTIGDSITKGWPYVPYNQYGTRVGVYQPKLEQLLYDSDIPSHVYNWGIGGESTPEGVNRITTVLASRSADYILIMEGANDVLNGISSSTTQYNIGVMIDHSLSWGVTPICGTITPDTISATYDERIQRDYNPKLISIALLKGVKVSDQYNALRPEWTTQPLHSGDNLHPDIEGYTRIAKTWYRAIVPVTPITPVGAIMLLLK